VIRLCVLVALSLVGLGLTLPGAHPPSGSLPWVLALAACALEAGATRLPGAGLASCGFAAVLALALNSQGGPALAGVVAMVALILRGLGRGHPLPQVRALESAADMAPTLAAVAAVHLLGGGWPGGLAATAVYLILAPLCAEALADELPAELARRFRAIQVPGLIVPRLSCCSLGLVALPAGPALPLLLGPLLLTWRSIRQTVLLEEQDESRNLVRQLDRSQTRVHALNDQLQEQQDEFQLLEASSRAFLRVQSRREAAGALVRLCQSLVRCQSVAVFAADLEVLGASTPHADRLQHMSLLRLCEPHVNAVLGAPDVTTARVFKDELHAAAFPLGSAGALYVGRPDTPFTGSELRYLGQAASQGALGLQVAGQLEALHEAMLQHRWLGQQAQLRANALSALLESALHFLDKLDPQVLAQGLERCVDAVFAPESREVGLGGPHPLAACQAVLETRAPLLIDEIERTRFEPHRPGQHSLLCVPIVVSELEPAGFILLGASPPGAFDRQHQDLLSLLAYLAGVAWKNARLHAQLVQTSKLAAVGQLAAGIAHELNTPLASIALSLDLGIRSAAKDPQAAVARMHKGLEMVNRTKEIVDKLLYYSRAGGARRVTDFNQLVRDTLELMNHPLGQDGVSVTCQPAPAAEAMINANEIQQVLFNLLLNARDAVKDLPPERRDVEVQVLAENGRVGFRVRDRGPGIPAENRARVFDPFFTTKPIGSGTGLGLSVSAEIVAAHQGGLTVESREGEGSTFTLWVPTGC